MIDETLMLSFGLTEKEKNRLNDLSENQEIKSLLEKMVDDIKVV